jgi:hypothetical protein
MSRGFDLSDRSIVVVCQKSSAQTFGHPVRNSLQHGVPLMTSLKWLGIFVPCAFYRFARGRCKVSRRQCDSIRKTSGRTQLRRCLRWCVPRSPTILRVMYYFACDVIALFWLTRVITTKIVWIGTCKRNTIDPQDWKLPRILHIYFILHRA